MEFTAGIYTVCQPVSPVPPSTPRSLTAIRLTTSDTVRSFCLERHNRQCRAGVISNGNLRNDLPLSLFTRLRDIISRQLKRPGYYVRSTTPAQHAQSTKPLIPKRLVVFSQLAGFIMEMWRDFDIRLNNLAAKLLKAMTGIERNNFRYAGCSGFTSGYPKSKVCG